MRSALHKRERGFFHYSFSRARSKSGNVLLFNSVTLKIYQNECLSNYVYVSGHFKTRHRGNFKIYAVIQNCHFPWIMDGQIRKKHHQTSKVWAFWACQLAAQTKSIYVEKNVAQTHWYMRVRRVKIKVFKKLLT